MGTLVHVQIGGVLRVSCCSYLRDVRTYVGRSCMDKVLKLYYKSSVLGMAVKCCCSSGMW